MDPDVIDRVVRKFAAPGLDRGYSAHPMRATSSPRHSNTAHLEGVQKAAIHRDPSTP
jgi:hypothetical protein